MAVLLLPAGGLLTKRTPGQREWEGGGGVRSRGGPLARGLSCAPGHIGAGGTRAPLRIHIFGYTHSYAGGAHSVAPGACSGAWVPQWVPCQVFPRVPSVPAPLHSMRLSTLPSGVH